MTKCILLNTSNYVSREGHYRRDMRPYSLAGTDTVKETTVFFFHGNRVSHRGETSSSFFRVKRQFLGGVPSFRRSVADPSLRRSGFNAGPSGRAFQGEGLRPIAC
jgi:hypothetical protein